MSDRQSLVALREAPGYEGGQRFGHVCRLRPPSLDLDCDAGAGGEHHQAHDRGSANAFRAAGDPDLGVILFHDHDEFGRGAGMQPTLVADLDRAGGVGIACRPARPIVAGASRLAHLPVRTRLAMVTYLRPASWAAATASCSGHSSRTLASLTSIGRLMPASTSTCGRLITEIARFEGVPPNMSVKMATPWPLSTRLTASTM